MNITLLFVTGVFVVTLSPNISAHAGHSNPEPWSACDEHQLDADCRWSNADHDTYIGTCREIGDDLMCVRSQPIQRHKDVEDRAIRTSWLVAGVPLAVLLCGFAAFRKREN